MNSQNPPSAKKRIAGVLQYAFLKKTHTMNQTRLSKVKGFSGLILGRDLAGVFTDGHVYAAKKVGGMILIEDLGEHADTFTDKVLVALVQDTNPYVLGEILKRKKIPFTVLLLLGSFDSPYFVEAIQLLDLYFVQVQKHLKGWRFYKKKIRERYKNRTDKRANTVAFIC